MYNIWKIAFFAFFVFSCVLVANAESIAVKAIDTIAGYATTLETAQIEPNINITFQVEKPNGSVINISAKTNSKGLGTADFDGYHTKIAGNYQVKVAREGKDFGGSSMFRVYSDVFSPIKSQISLDKSTLSVKNDTLVVRVQIRDKYDNPISGQLIKLISSRSEDSIVAENTITNNNGDAIYNVSSDLPGVSVFTAINQTLNQEIQEREKVVFYSQEENTFFGGDLFSANLTEDVSDLESELSNLDTNSSNSSKSNKAKSLKEKSDVYSDEAGYLDNFSIEFPDTVKINDDQNHLKVIAKDSNGDIVRSYTGTIKIEVVGDDNAIIPNEGEYTFSEQDQGEKEFALAMVFTSTGEKTIRVYDYENGQINQSIKGEKKVNVVTKDITPDTPSTDDSMQIKSPVNGSELASSTLTVSGLALPNTNLKLMLDDEKVADVSVDPEGFFSTTLQDLKDGKHNVYVIEIEGQRRASGSISFTIDATQPSIDSFEVYPKDAIYPETEYTVTIMSEPNLDVAKIRVAGTEEQLSESPVTPGKYEGTFIAPQNPGTYNIDIILKDRLGNQGEYRNQTSIEVIKKVVIKPGKVEELIATEGDEKIDITWKKPESEREISNYNIYVGETQYDLKLYSQVKTLSTLIEKVKNGKKYFISVAAVDIEGEEGVKSDILISTPKKEELMCTGNKYSVTGKEPCMICPSPYVVSSDNTECTHSVAPIETPTRSLLRAMPGDSKVTLAWEPFKGASSYKVFFGISPKRYEVELETEDNMLSYVVKDLINGLPYFFSLVALDEDGFEISQKYPDVRSTPTGIGFNVIPSKREIPESFLADFSKNKQIKGSTGPEEIVFIALSFVTAFVILYLRKGRKIRISMPYKKTSSPVIRNVSCGGMQF